MFACRFTIETDELACTLPWTWKMGGGALGGTGDWWGEGVKILENRRVGLCQQTSRAATWQIWRMGSLTILLFVFVTPQSPTILLGTSAPACSAASLSTGQVAMLECRCSFTAL